MDVHVSQRTPVTLNVSDVDNRLSELRVRIVTQLACCALFVPIDGNASWAEVHAGDVLPVGSQTVWVLPAELRADITYPKLQNGSLFTLDSFLFDASDPSGSRSASATFDLRVIAPASLTNEYSWLVPAMCAVGAVLGIALCSCGGYLLRRWLLALRAQLTKSVLDAQANRMRVLRATSATLEVRCPLALVSLKSLRAMGSLVPYEQLRTVGVLHVLDTYDEVQEFARLAATCFISHQWLDRTSPDPDGVHYKAILSACEELCQLHGVDAESLWLWIDITCIPQRNRTLKKLASERHWHVMQAAVPPRPRAQLAYSERPLTDLT